MESSTDLIAALCRSQLHDGGWGYRGSSSWTEPTAMALIALAGQSVAGDVMRRGQEWLYRNQRSDGGWRPRPSVDESTWVTSLALLVPGLRPDVRDRGLNWLTALVGRESSRTQRLRDFLLGYKPEIPTCDAGWPWFPDSAGWVTPTVMSILALKQAAAPEDSRVRERVGAGVRFLIARQCPDGGWNHGSSRALGYDLPSYPESTGQALLALQGAQWESRETSLRCAERHLSRAVSVEAVGWLRLALAAHGRRVDRTFPRAWSSVDLALQLIVEAAGKEMNPFA